MKYAIVVLTVLLVGSFHIEAKKAAKKHEAVKPKAKIQVVGGFRVPAIAFRIPFFGGFPFLVKNAETETKFGKMPIGQFHDFTGKSAKLKTRTKTSNSTNGPFKTFTVISETVSAENKSNPKVFEKVIKSVTTLDKNATGGKNASAWKIPRLQTTHFLFRPFGFSDNMDDDVDSQKCSAKKPCQANLYCDSFFGVCKRKISAGGTCTQKDQCAAGKARYQCTWGRCVVNSQDGSAGTFCDGNTECHSSGDEELGCFDQSDISRFSKVCVPKLGEGATCGRAGIFDMFTRDEEISSRCKGHLVCRAVGFFGRKACIQNLMTGDEIQSEHKTIKKSKSKKSH